MQERTNVLVHPRVNGFCHRQLNTTMHLQIWGGQTSPYGSTLIPQVVHPYNNPLIPDHIIGTT